MRRPFTEVARQIGVTDDTVRARIRRMQDDGFLVGWETAVNPSVLDRQLITVDVPRMEASKKDHAIEMIRLLEGVRWIVDKEGGLFISFFQRPGPDFDRIRQLVSGLCDAPATSWKLPVPPATRTPSPADWRLISAIRRDSRRSMKELEDLTGMSRRTIQRRLARLSEGKVIFTTPETDLTRLRDRTLVAVRIDNGGRVNGIPHDVLVGHESMVAAHLEGPSPVCLYLVEERAEAARIEDRMKQALDEQSVQVEVFRRRITCHAWLDDAVDQRVRSTS